MTEPVALPNESGCSLSLHIMPGDGKCSSYRRSGSMSCRGCEAWLQSQIKSVQEDEAMAAKCKVNNCEKQAQHGKAGMCKAHFSAAQREAGVSSETPIYSARAEQVNDEFCDNCMVFPCVCFEDGSYIDFTPAESVPFIAPLTVLVTNADGDQVPLDVNELISVALDEAMAEVKQDWFCELSGLMPGKAIVLAARMVEAIKGLEY